jgi:hypothetical protein
MKIDEDANGTTIAAETVAAARECARMIGKIGPTFTAHELSEMEAAIRLMTNAIDLKKRMREAKGA